jgi:hypothetical protein
MLLITQRSSACHIFTFTFVLLSLQQVAGFCVGLLRSMLLFGLSARSGSLAPDINHPLITLGVLALRLLGYVSYESVGAAAWMQNSCAARQMSQCVLYQVPQLLC